MIVVGVDGSDHAAKALAWALDEAKLRDLALTVIYAFPAMLSLAGTTAHEYYPQVKQEAQETLDRALAAMPDSSGVRVHPVLVAGSPAKVLIEASREARMLVIGSRGIGGFRGLVMGSVSIQCVSHAHCPVVVVRSAE